jgi:hypothetical protein
MPIYEYKGQQYDLTETDPAAAKAKILSYLGEQPAVQAQQPQEPSMFGMGSPVQRVAKGAIVDPALAIAQMATGAAGAIGIPGAAEAEKSIREFGRGVEEKTQAGREARGSEGLDFYQLLGNVLGSAAPASLLARIGTGVKAAAATGAATSVATQPVLDQEASLLQEKAKQTGIGAAGGAIGQKVVGALGRVLSPQVSAQEAAVRGVGVTPTIGESLGGTARKIEDFIAGIPGLGEFVKDAKLRAIDQWNKGTINKTLSNLPDDIKIPEGIFGGEAVAYANQAISKSYDDLYGKMSYTLGKDTNNKLVDLAKSKALTPDQQGIVQKALDSFLYSKLDTPLAGSSLTNAPAKLSTVDGATMKAIESDLKSYAYGLLKKTQGQTADDIKAGEAILDAVGTLKKDFYRQNAKTVSVKDLLKLDKAYSEMAVITDASARAEAGLFTPSQLMQASKANARKVSTRAFGEGRAVLQKDAQAAKEIIGDGKAGLVARIGGLGALGVAGVAGLPATVATVGGVAGIYSKTGQKLIDKLLTERPELAKQLGESLFNQRAVGAIGGGPLANRLFQQ